MATSDNVQVKPRSTIIEQLTRAKTASESESANDGENAAGPDGPERSDPLPRPGSPYLAHARRTAKPQMTLFFVGKDYLPDGYSYANLERVWLAASEKEGSGPVLKARFYGSVVTEVTIEGRHLHTLCNAIGMHLMPWVWEHPSPRDFDDENETVIRKITPNIITS
jgi:hypothetical protein